MANFLDEMIDPATKDIHVTVTGEMHRLAGVFAVAYRDTEPHPRPKPDVQWGRPAEKAYTDFCNAVYAANPHLGPNAWETQNHTRNHLLIRDLRSAAGGVLNNLLAEEFAKCGVENPPRPFPQYTMDTSRGR